MNNVLFSRKSDEWETPKDLYQTLDAEFRFSLDPCSTDINAKCENHYTAKDNGLAKNWGGREYFAILHTARLKSGCRSALKRRRSRGPSLWPCFRAGQTPDGSMITYWIEQRSGSSGGGSNFRERSTMLRSRR